LASGRVVPGITLLAVDVIYGINAVGEALKSRGRGFEYVGVARERHDQRVQRIIDECRRQGVAVRFVPRRDIERLAGNSSHQGVIAVTSAKIYTGVDEILERKRGEHALVLVLDGVEDPHNLGAIIRTADGAGADGVLIPERRAAGVTATVAKASAGAVEHVPIAKITNVARTLEELKTRNLWTVGLDERASQDYDTLDYNLDCALVLGAEGQGLHELVRKRCDFLVSIPMLGRVASLNVSVAAAVVLYEIARQRRRAASQRNRDSRGPAQSSSSE
jgi:23S rRNA (guanosine2251-2'-O)-methyltransferase